MPSVKNPRPRIQMPVSSITSAKQTSLRLLKGIGRRAFHFYNLWTSKLRANVGTTGFALRNALLGKKPITVRLSGLTYDLLPEGAVARDIWSKRYFEKCELHFVLGRLQPGMTFFDIGANVGLFSIPAAKRVCPGQVYAFEPTAWTFERLKQNARLNRLENLQPFRSAVGDYSGETRLQTNAAGKDGLNTIGKPTHEDSEIIGVERVPITTLDEFIQENFIRRVDVMKVDVEGAELLVFRGAKSLLAKPDAPLILYESGCLTRGFSYHPVETMWLLEQYDYRFFMIDGATERITLLSGFQPRDAMLIAAKPGHPFYASLQEPVR